MNISESKTFSRLQIRAFVVLLLLAGLSASLGATFRNPLNDGPDPYMTYYRGNYYLATTQGTAIRIWKSPTLGGLAHAPAVTVWTDGEASRCCDIWAPEFHLLDGPAGKRWYIYYTADDRTDSHHRMYVLESQGMDPLGPYAFKAKLATDPKDEFYAIDGTVFNAPDGGLYFLWAGYPGHRIFISKMNNPWTTTGARTLIPADGFGCEEVREGPATLLRNGRIFLTYSACDTQKPDYMLGMVVADDKADLMKAESWIQYPGPVFKRADANGVYGPGHHGFFQSPDGTEDWIVYLGKTTSAYTYAGRTTRAQKFTWRKDGTPDFGIPLPLDADIQEPSEGKTGVATVPLRAATGIRGETVELRVGADGRRALSPWRRWTLAVP